MTDILQIVQKIENLLDKGVILKFQEEQGKITFFKKRKGAVFVKGRDIKPKPKIDCDGWEIKPLEFQDWWVDILIDGLCIYVFIVREHSADEVIVWDSQASYFNSRAHLLPPPSIMSCSHHANKDVYHNISLQIMALKVTEEEYGHKHVQDTIYHLFDKDMIIAFNEPRVWWIAL